MNWEYPEDEAVHNTESGATGLKGLVSSHRIVDFSRVTAVSRGCLHLYGLSTVT